MEHHQPMDAHRLMSIAPQLLPTPTHTPTHTHTHTHTHIISTSLQDVCECIYALCICARSVCFLCVFCLRLCMRLSVCWRACMSVHTGWSLCVVSPNWGSNTAVLSLAFPSFSPRLCHLDTDKHRGRIERVQCFRILHIHLPYVV